MVNSQRTLHCKVRYTSTNGKTTTEHCYSKLSNRTSFDGLLKNAVYNGAYMHIAHGGKAYSWKYKVLMIEEITVQKARPHNNISIKIKKQNTKQSLLMNEEIKNRNIKNKELYNRQTKSNKLIDKLITRKQVNKELYGEPKRMKTKSKQQINKGLTSKEIVILQRLLSRANNEQKKKVKKEL